MVDKQTARALLLKARDAHRSAERKLSDIVGRIGADKTEIKRCVEAFEQSEAEYRKVAKEAHVLGIR